MLQFTHKENAPPALEAPEFGGRVVSEHVVLMLHGKDLLGVDRELRTEEERASDFAEVVKRNLQGEDQCIFPQRGTEVPNQALKGGLEPGVGEM